MSATAEAARMYTQRGDEYHRLISFFLYPQGLRGFFGRFEPLRAGMRILDAGCGSGPVTLAVHEALQARRLRPGRFDGFDLTRAQLDRFRATIERRGLEDFHLRQANVLKLDQLPVSWTGYDLIVSSAMLEYVPTSELPVALEGLRQRLGETGRFLLFITRTSWMMRLLIEKPWDSNAYTKNELMSAMAKAGFADLRVRRFPFPFNHLNLWAHIVEAGR